MRSLIPKLISNLRATGRGVFVKHSLPRWTVFLFDLSAVFIAFIFAYLLRFNFEPEAFNIRLVLNQSLLVIALFTVYELIFKTYAGLIRHTTIRDITNVLVTTSFTLLTLSILVKLNGKFEWHSLLSIPLSIVVIHYIALTASLFFARILIKMFYEIVSVKPVERKKVVIYGAGAMGLIVKRVVQSDTSNQYQIAAFLDNNRKLHSKKISGVPVIDPKKLTREYLDKHGIESMIFAIKDIVPAEKSEIYRFAVELGLEVLEVPGVKHWLNGQLQLDQLKKIKLKDLLGREPIQMNLKMIEHGLKGKSILVTGAAGSIGSEIVRQLVRFETGVLILVDNAETPMFKLEGELKELCDLKVIRMILADVTDQVKMKRLFEAHRPDIVFHAAAYKHVPLMEDNPHEAIRVNVGGTMLLTRLAKEYKVSKFVMVSTDKAVNPTNIMGASKRMCEMILQARSITPGNRVQFVITRFGNVLGSNGSVIPIFQKQIEEGGPVTVTHPEIIRYFMTIPEACQLVLEAGFMGMGGEIFVFDMGKPVKIDDMARQMIRLSGYEPDKDIAIEYTGLRPGEKLYEELLTDNEKTMPTYNPKVKVAEVAWLNHRKVLALIHELLYTYMSLDNASLVGRIMDVVPEFSTTNAEYQSIKGSSDPLELEIYPD